MATFSITLTIDDSNVSDYINGLEKVVDRPVGASDLDFIKIAAQDALSERISDGLLVVANESTSVPQVTMEVS